MCAWAQHPPAVEKALTIVVHHLCAHEKVFINVLDEVHKAHVASLFDSTGTHPNISFLTLPTNDSWCRDHGATFIINKKRGKLAAINWNFNSWGGKYPPFDLDNRVPRLISEYLGVLRNGVILLPTYNDPNDAEAAAILRDCFPGREVIPIDCTSVIWGLGAFHCLTQQVPWSVSLQQSSI